MIARDAVWLITGCSKGLGRALAEQVLAAGYRVVVTARRAADIDDLVGTHGARCSTPTCSGRSTSSRPCFRACADVGTGTSSTSVRSAGS